MHHLCVLRESVCAYVRLCNCLSPVCFTQWRVLYIVYTHTLKPVYSREGVCMCVCRICIACKFAMVYTVNSVWSIYTQCMCV